VPIDNYVAERLQELLAERGLGPGDRLPPERQLASDLGLARSSLREGLRRLVDLGLVRSRQGSGNYLTAVDLDDLVAARLQLEPYAARLAARRRTADDLARLDDVLLELRATRDDPAAFAAADERLHRIVVDASRSPALRVLLDALEDLLRYSRATTAADPTVRGATFLQLERLVNAIRREDSREAEREMRAHLRTVASALPSKRQAARDASGEA
jgi:GntR family transcriptional repressor for pyruvate dehydrogenase complex